MVPMKILQVANSFKYAWGSGGVARVAYDISLSLTKRGHKVTVFTTDKGLGESYSVKTNNPISLDGMQVYYFRNLSRGLARKGIAIPFYSLFIVRKILPEFDVIHIHELRRIINILIYYYARKYSIPYIFQAHGSILSSKSRHKRILSWIFDTLFGYKLLKDASKVIALTRIEAQQYENVGIPEEEIAIIPNGIDLSEYADLPPKGAFKKKFGIKEDEKIVLYVGRIHESKGLDILTYAFNAITKNFGDVRLVVIGPDDGYLATFSRLISDLGIKEKILLTGFVDKKDKLAAFIDSDVFVTPRFYGFPITFLEACLASCPIVTASDELDWINNNVGYVTEYSSNALAKGVANVLQDEQINRKFRNNCRHMIKKFDISTVTSQLENIYKVCSCDYYEKTID